MNFSHLANGISSFRNSVRQGVPRGPVESTNINSGATIVDSSNLIPGQQYIVLLRKPRGLIPTQKEIDITGTFVRYGEGDEIGYAFFNNVKMPNNPSVRVSRRDIIPYSLEGVTIMKMKKSSIGGKRQRQTRTRGRTSRTSRKQRRSLKRT